MESSSSLRSQGSSVARCPRCKVVFPPKELVVEDKKTTFANPEYARMAAREHQVLNYLLSSLSHEMLLQATTYDTPEEV
jgi:hypothetical protein